MTLRVLAAAFAALSTAACVSTTGVERVDLDPSLAAQSRIGAISMTSGWLQSEEDFSDTFVEAVREHTNRCATGPKKLNLRLHVDEVRRADRLDTVLHGGEHRLAAIAELVDPATRAVVGRYPIAVAVDAGTPLAALLADRQVLVSDAFGAELCRQAFGTG
jgi:hypothetical protein